MKHAWLILALWLLAAPAVAQDGIDLSRAVFYGPDLRQLTPTVAITAVEFGTGDTRGVRLVFDRSVINARWPPAQVWNNNAGNPLDGQIQWTFGACARIAGVWHCGAAFEFWGDSGGRGAPKEWTGAPPLERAPDGRTHWQANWYYDRGRFGELAGYIPQVGDEVGFYMVAGGVRPGSSNHPTVPERSNVVRVRLAPVGMVTPIADTVFVPAPTPTVPAPVPAPVPTVPVQTSDAMRVWAEQYERWARDFAASMQQQTEYQNQLLRDIQAQNERIYQDLIVRIEASATKAPTEPVKVDQGNVRGIVNLILSIAGAVGGGIAAVR